MTHKVDTFWERYPPVGMEASSRPGLEAVEVVNSRQVGFYVLMTLSIVGLILIDGIEGLNWFLEVLRLVLIVSFWPLVFLSPALDAFWGPRYRLYQDNSVAPEFDGMGMPLRKLLPEVAGSPRLMERLEAPEGFTHPPVLFKNLFPELSTLLVLYLVGIPLCALGGGLVLLLTQPFSGVVILILCFALVYFAAPLVVVWWMRRRVSLGLRVLGTGDAGIDGDAPMAGFDEVQDLSLEWDVLLGRPYLLLDLYGQKIRYYNPVKEPLHLLRLAKHRMPHLTLRVEGYN